MKRLGGALLALWWVSGASFGQPTLTFGSAHSPREAELALTVLREAYGRLNVNIEHQPMPSEQALVAAHQGQTDGDLQRIDGMSEHYPNLIQLSVPVNHLQLGVFSTRRDIELDDWYSLHPYRIGILRGALSAERGAEGLDVIRLDSYPALLDALEAGHIDVAVMHRIGAQALLSQRAGSEVVDLGVVLESAFLYHYLHQRHSQLADQLNNELKSMLLDGTIPRLHRAGRADNREEATRYD